MDKLKYILYRTGISIVLLFGILTAIFFFFRFMPGSYTDIMTFTGAESEVIEEFEEDWGLNDPLYVQYFRWITNLAQGDAGMSLQFRRPVWDVVSTRIFNSFILVAPAITLAYVCGSIIGTIIANKRAEDYVLPGVIFVGSFPEFFIAIVLMIVFAGWLGWFPTSGMITTDTRVLYADDPWWRVYLTRDFLMHFTLPFMAVFLRYLFLPLLIMRTSVSEVRNQGFFYYYRMAGISKVTQMKHLAKHSSLPVITLYPVSMTRAIGGLVLIEVVFSWPGIGYTLINAVLARDFPIVQFVFALIAIYIIFANYLVDIIYGVIDPRISVSD